MVSPINTAHALPSAAAGSQRSGGSGSGGGGDDVGSAVAIHPLVVLAISDHFNRFAAMRLFPSAASAEGLENPPPPTLLDAVGGIRVVGLLLGEQNGRAVDVCHSIELPVRRADDGSAVVDTDFMTSRIDQYKQIFPRYDVVGWYTTGASVSSDDLRLHKDVFSILNESPFLLVMDISACMSSFVGRMTPSTGPPVSTPTSSSSLPSCAAASIAHNLTSTSSTAAPGALTVFQAEMQIVAGTPTSVLSPVAHRFASADSERIAVDHVSRHAVPGGSEGFATQHLGNLRRSVQMLSTRVDLLVRFIDATAAGRIPVDHALLRKVSGVCSRLPTAETAELATAFMDEQHDAMVVTYLCGVTKSLCAMNDLVDNYSLVFESGGKGNPAPGLSGPGGSGGGRRRL
jgi:COP9 signalosome complex subunit 6